jgi:hypothetical protein
MSHLEVITAVLSAFIIHVIPKHIVMPITELKFLADHSKVILPVFISQLLFIILRYSISQFHSPKI